MTEIRGHRLDRGCGAVFANDRPRTCPVCREKFRYTNAWVYRRGQKIFCSWRCVRAWDKGAEAKQQEKHERVGGRISNPTSRMSVTVTGGWTESAEGCRARIEYCRALKEKYRDKLKAYQDPDGRAAYNTAAAAKRWELREAEARRELEKYGGMQNVTD